MRLAYTERAAEYIDLLGAIKQMAPEDQNTIREWALGLTGPILDAGSGPGHWTNFLHQAGADVTGIDLVPDFVHSARLRFPDVNFSVGDLAALPQDAGSLSGILAWYSLIHFEPARLPQVLNEFARALAPGGALLVGFFPGPVLESFDHKVHTAYFWPINKLRRLVEESGFEVLEVHERHAPGQRAHAALSARRTSA